MIQRVAITGAAGFLGTAITRSLRAAGWEVLALDRGRADVTRLESLVALAEPVTAVIHLAFVTDPARRRQDPLEALRVATCGTVHAVHLALACRARQVVLASSGKVYGFPERLPSAERDPVRPTTFLGRLKATQEDLLRLAVDQRPELGASVMRLFNVYGPGAPPSYLIPTLIAGFLAGERLTVGELDHRRDWIHLDDACRAFAIALERPPQAGSLRLLNVGSGRSLSVRDWAGLLASLSGRQIELHSDPVRLRPDEPSEERADGSHLRALGWQPEVAPEEGLRRLLDAGVVGG